MRKATFGLATMFFAFCVALTDCTVPSAVARCLIGPQILQTADNLERPLSLVLMQGYWVKPLVGTAGLEPTTSAL